MDTPGLIGPAVTFIGVGLILVTLVRWPRHRLPTKYRPEVWLWTSDRRQVRDWLRGTAPVPPDELVPLQTAAEVRVEQRWFLLFCLGSSVAQVGGTIGHTGLVRLTLTGCFVVFMAVSAVLIERQARLGADFLRRNPLSTRADQI